MHSQESCGFLFLRSSSWLGLPCPVVQAVYWGSSSQGGAWGLQSTSALPSKLCTLLWKIKRISPIALVVQGPKEIIFVKFVQKWCNISSGLGSFFCLSSYPGPIVSTLPQDWYPERIPKYQASLKPRRLLKFRGNIEERLHHTHNPQFHLHVFSSCYPLLSKIPKCFYTTLLMMWARPPTLSVYTYPREYNFFHLFFTISNFETLNMQDLMLRITFFSCPPGKLLFIY